MASSKKYKKIIAIITHKGNAEKTEAIKKTWLSKSFPNDYLVLFIYGSDGGVVPRIEGDKLFLAAKESWENLPNKIYELYQYCAKNYAFEYLFKIDDDVYVSPSRLVGYPANAVDYAGKFNYRPTNSFFNYGERFHNTEKYQGKFPCQYANGSLYVLSRRAVDGIVSFPKDSLEDCALRLGYEDAMIGKCMEALSVQKPGVFIFEDWHKNFFRGYFVAPYYSNDLSADQIIERHRFWCWRVFFIATSSLMQRFRSFVGLRTRLAKIFKIKP